MNFNKKKWAKLTGILLISSSMTVVPIITTSCGASTTTNKLNEDSLIKKNATVITNFESVLDGLKASSNMNVAVTSILNTEYSKRQLIQGYDSLENKESVKISVSGIETNTDSWGGTRSYLSWKSDSGVKSANVNDFLSSTQSEVPIEISSLGELKTKLTPELLAELLKNAGINIEQLLDIKLVENSKIGMEKTNDEQSTIDVIHVNVQAKQIVSQKEGDGEERPDPVTQDVKYNLSIPIVSIIYKLDNLKVQLNINNKIQDSTTNLKIKFGTEKKVENNKKNQVIIPWKENEPDINDLSMKQVFKQINWIPAGSNIDDTNEKIELNSIQIGKDLGIYNVEFLNPQDITQYPIGHIQYQGMSYILDARPINGYTWSDGTTDKISLTLNKMNVLVQDSFVKGEEFSDANPYTLEWSKLFSNSSKIINATFPDSLENLKSILTNKESFEEFQKAILSNEEYKKNIKSVYFTVNESDITELNGTGTQEKTGEKAYKVVMTVETIPGHVMMSESTKKPGDKLVFKIVNAKPAQA